MNSDEILDYDEISESKENLDYNEISESKENLDYDKLISEYKEKYENKKSLPIDPVLAEPFVYEGSCQSLNNFFNMPENISENENEILITNIQNKQTLTETYHNLFSLRYNPDTEEGKQNTKSLNDFILSQTDISPDDNIITSKMDLPEFMKILSSCNNKDKKPMDEKIKFECSKDAPRQTIFINGKLVRIEVTEADTNESYNGRTDQLNLEIMEEMKNNHFEDIKNIYKYLVYIDLMTAQTILNVIQFDVMGQIINSLKIQPLFFQYNAKSREVGISVLQFIIVKHGVLQLHRIRQSLVYDAPYTNDEKMDDLEKGLNPDGMLTCHVIFDLLKNNYYIKNYFFHCKRNDEESVEHLPQQIAEPLNQPTNFQQIKETVSSNKLATSAGTLLAMSAVAAIPIALLLGGKKTKSKRFKRKNTRKKNKNTNKRKKHSNTKKKRHNKNRRKITNKRKHKK